ncbi:MAG TPA: hypothetical protein VFL76_10035 [Edaphocola sp.]|nr:hypothetical protein [Edaphocola sp.]
MKKLILIFSFAAGFSLLGTAASAQTGILHGLTTPPAQIVQVVQPMIVLQIQIEFVQQIH